MLTKDKIDKIRENQDTVEKRIIILLWDKYKGSCKSTDLVKDLAIDRKILLNTHVRKSCYLSFDKEHDLIKLHRKGKDISLAGYCSPAYGAESIAQFVFSILYDNIDMSFEESCSMVRNFCTMKDIFLGDYCNSRTKHYAYYRKLARKWLIATGKIESEGI